MSQHSAFAIARRSWFCPQSISKNGLLGSPEIPFRQAVSETKAKAGIVAAALRNGLGCFIALTIWLCAGSQTQAQSIFPLTPVGTPLQQVVTITSPGGGTVNSVQVRTMGATGLDFAASGASTCSGTLGVGASCTQQVTFTPKAPGTRMGAVVLLDVSNNVLGTAFISGIGQGGLGVLRPNNAPLPFDAPLSTTVLIVAGSGPYLGPLGDGGPATNAILNTPSGVAVDGLGNLYISDPDTTDFPHNRIRKVDTSGNITTIANSTGTYGYSGDGLSALSAEINSPGGLAVDGAGNLYIADTQNDVIRMISAATGVITTVAGIGGSPGNSGEGGAATSAQLYLPQGVAIDASGNLWIADTGNNQIRKVDATTHIITRMAGDSGGAAGFGGDTGPAKSALLSGPNAVAFDPAGGTGNWYIADSTNNRVRMVTAGGTISSIAGNGQKGITNNGSATVTAVNSPSGLAVDPAGNLYIAEQGDLTNSEISKVSLVSGSISNVARNTTIASLYQTVQLYGPIGLTMDGNGNIFFADSHSNEIKEIPSNSALMDFTVLGAIRQNSASAPLYEVLENDGNAPLTLASSPWSTVLQSTSTPVVASLPYPNATVLLSTLNAPTPSPCPLTGETMNSNNSCTIAVEFSPATSNPPLAANTTIFTNVDFSVEAAAPTPGTNPTLTIETVGLASPLNSTTTTLASNPTPKAQYGSSVQLTATVTTGTGTLSGSVVFTDTYTDFNNATTVLTLSPNGGTVVKATGQTATATLSLTTLGVGSHSIVACYNNANDAGHGVSCSSPTNSQPTPLLLTIFELPNVLVSSSPASPSGVTATVVFTATLTVTGGMAPDGPVQFTDTPTVSGQTTTLCATGTPFVQTKANTWTTTCSTSALVQGPNLITANYQQVSPLVAPASGSMTQNVQAISNVTFSSSSNPSVYGSPVTFTFIVATGAGNPAATGTVNIYNGATKLTPAATSTVPGTWTYTTAGNALAVGTDSITAQYSGDSFYSANVPSASAIAQVVTKSPTTTVLTAPATGLAGLPIAMSATVATQVGSGTPTGSVTFMDGTTPIGTAALVSGKATLNPGLPLPVGLNSVTAVYNGDGNDLGSTSSPATPVAISLGTTTIAFVNPPTTTVVEFPVSFTVQVSSNGVTPTGSVVFFDETTPIGTVALVGGAATLTYTFTSTSATTPHLITATYAGDANNAPPAAGILPDPITVTGIPTQTTLVQTSTSGANPTLILVASVVGVDLPTQFPPSGTVVFTNGAATLGSAQLVDGVATFQPSATGALNVIATYSPTLAPVDPLHLGSASTPLAVTNNGNGFTLNAAPPKLTISPTQNATVTLTIAPVNGFKDTVGLGCASLPPGMTCTFSSLTTVLDGTNPNTITLTIDTNNPLLGGATAMNKPQGNGRFTLASIFWPFSLLMGLVLWRFRKRSTLLRNALLVLVFAGTAALVNGCGGIGKSAAVPGTYSIQVVGVGINSNISQYVPLTVVVTK